MHFVWRSCSLPKKAKVVVGENGLQTRCTFFSWFAISFGFREKWMLDLQNTEFCGHPFDSVDCSVEMKNSSL